MPMRITGKAIEQIPRGFNQLMNKGIGAEIIYAFVIILCSLMIYFGTRELYKLSGHKGIKYFRLGFLFFAIAYFFRSFIKIILFNFDKQEIRAIAPILFGSATLFIFIYFSVMAVFYLLSSVIWKKLDKKSDKIWIFHLTALIISWTLVKSGNSLVWYLLLNILLFGCIIFMVYKASHQSKKKGFNLYAIYILLFIFWILNILDILVPSFFQGFQLLIYIASIGVFLMIVYKVIKKTGGN